MDQDAKKKLDRIFLTASSLNFAAEHREELEALINKARSLRDEFMRLVATYQVLSLVVGDELLAGDADLDPVALLQTLSIETRKVRTLSGAQEVPEFIRAKYADLYEILETHDALRTPQPKQCLKAAFMLHKIAAFWDHAYLERQREINGRRAPGQRGRKPDAALEYLAEIAAVSSDMFAAELGVAAGYRLSDPEGADHDEPKVRLARAVKQARARRRAAR